MLTKGQGDNFLTLTKRRETLLNEMKKIYKSEEITTFECTTQYKSIGGDFVAIDFETATSKRCSACQLGERE